MKYIYTWVSVYQKIAVKLKEYQTDHIGLIKVLETIGVDLLNDKDAGGKIVPLTDIDPFTFISYLNKYGDDKRIKILNNLSQHWDLNETVYDVSGIPTSNAQKVWLFPYKFDRNNNEINRLWDFYSAVMNDTITNEQLIDIKSIDSVGWIKITEGMFNLKPTVYLPLNSVVNPYLSSLGVSVNNQSLDGITQTCQQVKNITIKPFYQVSYEGWLYVAEEKKAPRYWRLGTKAGNNGGNILPEMLENNIASIGWGNLGDLDNIIPLNKTAIQKLLSVQNYQGNNVVASRKAGEIINFVKTVSHNDYILAMDGAQVKALGKILHNEYIFLPNLEFPHARVVDWINTDITGFELKEGLQTTLTEITNKRNIDKIKALMLLPIVEDPALHESEQANVPALNQILFGPPGTGKTYTSIDKAVKIATGISGEHVANKIVFDRLRSEGQIEFVTFHQGYSYEDFMVGIKPNTDTEQLTFKPYKGIFYRLVERAKENYLACKDERSIAKSFDYVFRDLIAPLEESKEVKVMMTSGSFLEITDVENGTIRFKKPNGSETHTLSVETLRGIVEDKRDFHSGLGTYYKPLAKLLKEKQITQEPKAELKNYVIIIDEINRANISKVFGELITLLEDDKRIDEPNALAVTLPNGELNFSIPPNLYIVGTMNTADKSISLIDVALRRRFEFEGYYPDYEILEKHHADRVELLKLLNNAIYTKKKTADYLIGHGYFMKPEDIESIILKRIIPLLMEYFSGRIEEVESILKSANYEAKYNVMNYKWEINKSSAVINETSVS